MTEDEDEPGGSAFALYATALAIVAGGGSLGFAWGLALLLVGS
ncbi:hypothetical protein [Novosphingobium silvae]|nr:hypothetical protein [Novosphingobium silvae]